MSSSRQTSKNSKIGIKKTIFVATLSVILFMALIVILETILYNATFNLTFQPVNDYQRYGTLTYTPRKNPGEEGTVEALYQNRGDQDVFVYFHGNIGRLNYILEYLLDHTSFVAPAYPGYHRSEGKASVEATLSAVSDLLPEIEREFGSDFRLHLIGHSLGSQSASYFAHLLRDDPRLTTLSLVAGFPSIKNQCGNTLGLFSFLCFPANKSFDAASYLQDVGEIVINLYHLPTDNIIPYRDGRKLYEAIPLPETRSTQSQSERQGIKTFRDLTSGSHGNFDIESVVENALKEAP